MQARNKFLSKVVVTLLDKSRFDVIDFMCYFVLILTVGSLTYIGIQFQSQANFSSIVTLL